MVVFLDLAKAFDTVSHTILLKTLELYGIGGTALDWFKSYLLNRQQHCIVEGNISKPQTVSCGVPQGQNFRSVIVSYIYIYILTTCPLV